jgi:general secretion pathway protein A
MYNAHFSFREAPFGVTPDLQFYYSNSMYEEALATLKYGVEARKGFIVITGAPGTGKTTLIRKALHEFAPNVKAAYLPISSLAVNDLIGSILSHLSVAGVSGSWSVKIESLVHYLTEQYEFGNVLAVLIDEAQNLDFGTLEELRELGNLETGKDKLLQIVLVGQSELEDRLEKPQLCQLKQRVALRGRLRPIATAEVGPYINTRLRAAGQFTDRVFDHDAIQRIAQYSGGIPRVINIICDNALLTAYALSAREVRASMIDEIAADLRLRLRFDDQILLDNNSTPGQSTAFESQTRPPEKIFMVPLSEVKSSKTQSGKSRLAGRIALTAVPVVLGVGVIWQVSGYLDFGVLNRGTRAIALAARDTANVRSKSSRIEPAGAADRSVASLSINEPKPALAGSGARTEPDAASSSGQKTAKNDGQPLIGKHEPATNNNFVVTAASFVRAKPTSKAAILATLEPGTKIRVGGRIGEYFRVRVVGAERVTGYIHKQDAFFERTG